MSNFVIFKDAEYGILINNIEIGEIELGEKFCKICRVGGYARIANFKPKKPIQPKEQVFFLRNIIKAIDDGFVDFTDDKLYDYSFENNRSKDAGGWNNKFIDGDLKAEYKKELDFYYQKIQELIDNNSHLSLDEFMPILSSFLAEVLGNSHFNETPFDLREKFYDYLTYKFTL